MDIANIIQTVAIYALPVLFAITIHEAAHGYVARYFGENTAWTLGRVTLNPIKHIDPIGTIVMPLMLYIATSGAFLFGYAKPVPVQFGNLRHPKRDMVWVALAGPGSNLIQALLWGIGFYFLQGAGVTEAFFIKMCQAGILVNVVMFVFNLFPLPPLDGGRVLVGLLLQSEGFDVPREAAKVISSLQHKGMAALADLQDTVKVSADLAAGELEVALQYFPGQQP